ncbi:hypothetical protein QJS10_CPB17g01455 [Acorus calamus]|uniref:Dephospho-CoA kinase n=1 Tax=Acorus calamus TaxID=4465 RepID=A0AAV9CSS5_ACOCL|nr:hypothetical protein QJS10_CPB17g01455 [Acorus calamus]
MRIVGLTGGIASGKSTVSNLFKSDGVPDVVARKGTGGYKKVVGAFGDEILLDSGDVDRAHLGQIVFSDPSKRQLLNRIEGSCLEDEFREGRVDEMKENGRTIEDDLKFKGRS